MLGKLAVGAIIYAIVILSYFGWSLVGSTKLSESAELACYIAIFLIPLYCAISGVYCLEMHGLV